MELISQKQEQMSLRPICLYLKNFSHLEMKIVAQTVLISDQMIIQLLMEHFHLGTLTNRKICCTITPVNQVVPERCPPMTWYKITTCHQRHLQWRLEAQLIDQTRGHRWDLLTINREIYNRSHQLWCNLNLSTRHLKLTICCLMMIKCTSVNTIFIMANPNRWCIPINLMTILRREALT